MTVLFRYIDDKHMLYMKNFLFAVLMLFSFGLNAQIGRRFPSEKKLVHDPVTGVALSFLTSNAAGDSKIYQTHNQWTADSQWLIFRSSRVPGEAIAVNESSGVMVQVTEGGYQGMLNISRKDMNLYFMRRPPGEESSGAMQVVRVDLAAVFRDSDAGRMKKAEAYQRVCGVTPQQMGAGGDMAIDSDENWAYFRVGREEAARHLPHDTRIEPAYGPRNMGAGPSGIAAMNLQTGELKHVVSVPFQVGHIQTNAWCPGEIIFCWETGGKSPQRTWLVNSDGSGLRPLYPEASYEWVTHESVITKDEVAVAILGHRQITPLPGADTSRLADRGAGPGQERAWGAAGTREKPTGLAVINLRTRSMRIEGQTAEGSGFWHVNGSADGRFLVGDDFARNIYLINRRSHEMLLISGGHKTTAADHPHPGFSPDGTRVQIQSAMLSADGRSMNICIIPVPERWLSSSEKVKRKPD